jgi:hypothetical protein
MLLSWIISTLEPVSSDYNMRNLYDGQTNELLAFSGKEKGQKRGMVFDSQHGFGETPDDYPSVLCLASPLALAVGELNSAGFQRLLRNPSPRFSSSYVLVFSLRRGDGV